MVANVNAVPLEPMERPAGGWGAAPEDADCIVCSASLDGPSALAGAPELSARVSRVHGHKNQQGRSVCPVHTACWLRTLQEKNYPRFIKSFFTNQILDPTPIEHLAPFPVRVNRTYTRIVAPFLQRHPNIIPCIQSFVSGGLYGAYYAIAAIPFQFAVLAKTSGSFIFHAYSSTVAIMIPIAVNGASLSMIAVGTQMAFFKTFAPSTGAALSLAYITMLSCTLYNWQIKREAMLRNGNTPQEIADARNLITAISIAKFAGAVLGWHAMSKIIS